MQHPHNYQGQWVQLYWGFPCPQFSFQQKPSNQNSSLFMQEISKIYSPEQPKNATIQPQNFQQSHDSSPEHDWSPAEDQKLMNLIKVKSKNWASISQLMPGTTPSMCSQRFISLMNAKKKPTWTEKEEDKLRELVQLFGEHWKEISQYFPNRNPKQIRERYLNYLRPNLSSDKWEKQEDQKLIEHIKIYGHRWKQIEKKMKNRSQNQIKNRYYGHIKKLLKEQSLIDNRQNQEEIV